MNTCIEGDVKFDANADYSRVTEIAGSLDCYGADTRAAFAHVKFNDRSAVATCEAMLRKSFEAVGILFADGICAKVLSKKQKSDVTIWSVVAAGKTIKSFVVERNGVFSHGDTIKQALESVVYKLSDRDTSRFSEWTVETKVSFEDAVASYRAITGACEAGTRGFCSGQRLKKTYLVSEVIALTEGKFGADKYKEFFAKSL